MTETKFTPGPWHCASKKPRQISDKRGFKIAKCLLLTKGANFELSKQEGLANAHLIAAAPELYEALEQALAAIKDFLEYEHDGDPWTEDARAMGEMDIHEFLADGRFDSARAALAKARGEG